MKHYHAGWQTYENGIKVSDKIKGVLEYSFDSEIHVRWSVGYSSFAPLQPIECTLTYIVCPFTKKYDGSEMGHMLTEHTSLRWSEYLEQDELERRERIKYENDSTSPNMTVVNGLVKRWCRGTPGEGCGHFITTREELNDTDNCDELVADDDYVGWKAGLEPEWLTQEKSIQWLRHQPHCNYCLAHDNSYRFPAWYDIGRAQVERLVDLYQKYYPANIRQPFFFADDDRAIVIRMFDTQDVLDGDGSSEGDINLDTMLVKFNVVLSKPDYDKETEKWNDTPWVSEQHEFDLSKEQGWLKMLDLFPQVEVR